MGTKTRVELLRPLYQGILEGLGVVLPGQEGLSIAAAALAI